VRGGPIFNDLDYFLFGPNIGKKYNTTFVLTSKSKILKFFQLFRFRIRFRLPRANPKLIFSIRKLPVPVMLFLVKKTTKFPEDVKFLFLTVTLSPGLGFLSKMEVLIGSKSEKELFLVNLYLERLWGEWLMGSPPELGLPGILKMECSK
jgi:hypothetical protein